MIVAVHAPSSLRLIHVPTSLSSIFSGVLSCILAASCCAPTSTADPTATHAVAEIYLLLDPAEESRAAFYALGAAEQRSVIDQGWDMLHSRMGPGAIGMLGLHAIGIGPDGSPSMGEVEELIVTFRALTGLADDPPAGCRYDEHGRQRHVSLPLSDDPPAAPPVRTCTKEFLLRDRIRLPPSAINPSYQLKATWAIQVRELHRGD